MDQDIPGPPRVRAPRRRRRAVRWGLSALALAYGALVAFPAVLFAHEATHGRFRVLSDEPIDPAIARVLDRALGRMERSPLFNPKAEHRLHLAHAAWRRRLLSPLNAGAFGSTQLVRRNTILNRADIAADVIRNDSPHGRRTLSGVIAHERTHAMLMDHLGAAAYALLPSWKNEGYCDYVAGESSFDADKGRRLVREGRDDPSSSFRYFRSRLMVGYLLDVEGLSVEELLARDFDEAELMGRVRASLDRIGGE